MDVQIFGVNNNADVRKALRFFKERRAGVHFMDFKHRSPSKGELRRKELRSLRGTRLALRAVSAP